MHLILVGTGYDKICPQVGKLKVHLTSGLAEVLDQHQEMLGEIRKNFLEVETLSEGSGSKKERSLYFVQEGVFIITREINKLGLSIPIGEKTLYLYAKNIIELQSKNPILLNNLEKVLKEKKNLLEKKLSSLKQGNWEKNIIAKNGKIITGFQVKDLGDEIEFFEKSLLLAKDKNV